MYHTMSIRGEFWNMVTTALRHRASWAKRPLEKRVELAQKGYCPWVNGVGRVGPWRPTTDRSEPPRRDLKPCALAKGVSYDVLIKVIECCEAIERLGGRPWTGTDPDPALVRDFQGRVFQEVFGDPDPVFQEMGFTVKGDQPMQVALVVPRVWPQRKAQRQAERDDALAAMAAQWEAEESSTARGAAPRDPAPQPTKGAGKGSTVRGATPTTSSTARGAAGGKGEARPGWPEPGGAAGRKGKGKESKGEKGKGGKGGKKGKWA